MKIAYLLSHDIIRNDGVTKKILVQKKEWEKLGNEVKVFCFVPKKNNSILNAYQYEYGNLINFRLKKHQDLLNDLDIFKPDLIYFRYDIWSITLEVILQKYRVIAEINTFNEGEYWLSFKIQKNIKSLLRYLLYKLLKNKVLVKLDGIVTVTQEIAEYPSINRLRKDMICIPNSINLNEFTTIKSVLNNCEKTRLFFIGTPNQPWHGVDFIEKMAKLLPQYEFHIIGIKGINTENLFWYGYLSKAEYIKIIKNCHFGIGTLALYRNDMLEACPLKVREYLAYGYPIIIGYEDTAFKIYNELPDWLLQIDARNLEKEVDRIIEFIEKNKDKVLLKNDIEKYISSEIWEKKRIEFFKKILGPKDI